MKRFLRPFGWVSAVFAVSAGGSACGSGPASGPTPTAPAGPTSAAMPNVAGALPAGLPAGSRSSASVTSTAVGGAAGGGASAVPDGAPAPAGAVPAGTGGAGFCDVLRVVQTQCQVCHAATPVSGAPMPLVSYEDFMKPARSDASRKVYQVVQQRMHDQQRPMPPAGLLTPDRLALIDQWVQSGAAAASAACEPAPAAAESGKTAEVWPPPDCENIYRVVARDMADPSKPYTIAANGEEHPRIMLDAPWGNDDVQLLATRPITDNAAVVHHWILWDAKEGKNLTFWAPGAGGDVLPPDVGLYMPKGPGSLSLDMHYFNKNNPMPAPDQSGAELCVTRKFRPKTAALYGLRGNASVPAMQRASTPAPCTVMAMSDVHLLGINPHMHRMGVHARLELTQSSQPARVLYDGVFSFEEQVMKPLTETVIKNGDVLTTTCTFENTSAKDITWGDSTENEMCINWVRYYPKGAFTCDPAMQAGGRFPGAGQRPAFP